MEQQLAVRLGLLAATLSAVYWIGWPVPTDQRRAEDRPAVDGGLGAESAPAIEPMGLGAAETSRRQHEATHPAAGPSAPIATAASVAGPIDLNRAGLEELQGLPGMGPALAARVVEFRRAHGPFKTVDDLLRIKGIGQKRLDRLRGQVMVGRAERREQGGRL